MEIQVSKYLNSVHSLLITVIFKVTVPPWLLDVRLNDFFSKELSGVDYIHTLPKYVQLTAVYLPNCR